MDNDDLAIDIQGIQTPAEMVFEPPTCTEKNSLPEVWRDVIGVFIIYPIQPS